MKKISFKTARNLFADRLLTEEQMNALNGGMRCRNCNTDFEPSAIQQSQYACSGSDSHGVSLDTIYITAIDSFRASEMYSDYWSDRGITVPTASIVCSGGYDY